MATRLRSSTGCWTCRLRRKKCDETKPVCDRCSKLQLTCDGYAERPFWMDGGFQEKLRAEQTKREIRDKKSLSGVAKGSEQSIPQPATYQSILDLTMSELRTAETMDLVDPVGAAAGETFGAWQVEAHSLLAIHPDQDQGVRQDAHPSEQDMMQLFGPLWTSPAEELELHSFLPLSPSRSRASSSSPSASSSSMSGSTLCCVREHCTAQPTLEEAGLLLHYLDNLQTFLPPFCWPGLADRTWQYVLITRSRASYWATLSLSAYGLGQDGFCYYELALLELRKNLPAAVPFAGRDGSRSALDRCFSMLQLIFLEMLRGQSDNCRVHMSAAFSLLADLGKMCKTDSHTADSAALRFIAVSLRWCDAMLSCSLGTAPSLSSFEWPDTNVSLSSSTNTAGECDTVTCYHHWQDRVVASITQIAALDAWKKKVAEAGHLSVVELVKRMTAIETQLEECLRAVTTVGGGGAPDCPNLPPEGMQRAATATGKGTECPARLGRQITDIFASAALVYLHVVVAGAHRRVPDIYNRVRATVDLFRSLPSTQALTYFAWPLCLAGCLAEGEDRVFLMALAGRASAEETDAVRRIGKVVAILKECWRLADSGEVADPDWTSAMSSLGYEVILL